MPPNAGSMPPWPTGTYVRRGSGCAPVAIAALRLASPAQTRGRERERAAHAPYPSVDRPATLRCHWTQIVQLVGFRCRRDKDLGDAPVRHVLGEFWIHNPVLRVVRGYQRVLLKLVHLFWVRHIGWNTRHDQLTTSLRRTGVARRPAISSAQPYQSEHRCNRRAPWSRPSAPTTRTSPISHQHPCPYPGDPASCTASDATQSTRKIPRASAHKTRTRPEPVRHKGSGRRAGDENRTRMTSLEGWDSSH
jgi:hypothetical protein